MHVKIKVYEVSATGDAGVVREALQPLLDALVPKLGATMPGETVAFLAAHGFTVDDYTRGKREGEGVETFVARRELEQAGVKFTRRAPGQPIDLGAEIDKLCADLCTPRREPPVVVPDLKGQDPKTVRDRMNALPKHPQRVTPPDVLELTSGAVLAPNEHGDLFVVVPGPYPWQIGYVLVGRDEPLLATFGDLKAVRAAIKSGPPTTAKPTGCGLYPTEKGEAVPAPTPKRKPRKAAPKAGKRGSR